MKSIFCILLIYLTCAFLFTWWPFKENIWTGFLYPDKNNLEIFIDIGSFENIDDCEAALLNEIHFRDIESKATYECGLNCKYKPEYGVNVCEETGP